jgi:hypothetical protein
MANWKFCQLNKQGSIFGTNIKESLNDSKHTGEALLAREALQNSCDALNSSKDKVKILIKEITLTGSHKASFMKNLKIETIAERKEIIRGLRSENCLHNSENEGELKLLFIEDFNTHGLYGSFKDEHYRYSNLYKLLIQPGDNEKATAESLSGGSYGLGKAALSSNSRLSSIAVYSNYNDKYIDEKIKKRNGYRYDQGINTAFMACGYHEKHELDNKSFTGVAIFGEENNTDVIPNPIYNEAADEIAEKLFFTKRKEEDIGSSILIIDTELDIFKLKKAIEDYWWPKILDQEVEIEMVKGTNDFLETIEPPRPKLRTSLIPFIRAYERINKIQATGGKGDLKEFESLKSDSGFKIEKPGKLGLEQIQDEDTDGFVADENEEVISSFKDQNGIDKSKLNKVALIRHPKMVIDYYSTSTQFNGVYAVGVFQANTKDTFLDQMLKLSEPQSHEKWEPKAKRLNYLEINGAPFTDGENFVNSIITKIKRGFYGYLTELKKITKEEKPVDFKKLSKLLGQYLKPLSTGNSGVEAETRPISIQYYKDPIANFINGKNVITTTIDLSISKNYEEDELLFILKPRLIVLGHNDKSTGDKVSINKISLDESIKNIDFEFDDVHKTAKVTLLKSSGKARIEIMSEPFDPLWSVRLEPIISVDNREV